MNEWQEYFDKFMAELEEECAYEPKAVPAAQTPPPCTEILPEEAIKYIDVIRKAAYEQGYFDGRMKGIEDVKNRIKSSLDL